MRAMQRLAPTALAGCVLGATEQPRTADQHARGRSLRETEGGVQAARRAAQQTLRPCARAMPAEPGIDMVKPVLLRFGAGPAVVDWHGYTALHYAADAGNYAVVEALIQRGEPRAEVRFAEERTMKIKLFASILLVVTTIGWSAEPVTPEAESKRFFALLNESSPLHYNLVTRKHGKVFELLPLVEDIDAIEPVSGATPLTMAARDETADAYDMVKAMVVQYGADPTETDRNGFTPLHYAARAGNLAVVEFLVVHGADVNASPTLKDGSRGRQTPLYMAYARDKPRVVTYLQFMGAHRLDSEMQEELDFEAKVLQILDKFKYRRLPEGADPTEWRRKLLTAAHSEVVEMLVASGDAKLAESIGQAIEPLLEALANTPRPEGMSHSEWKRMITVKTFSNDGKTSTKETR